MSENKEENRKQENFWSRFIALMTALGGFGGLAALITVFNQCKAPSNNVTTSTPNQTSSPASQSSETTSSKSLDKLVVQANSPQGSSYTNSGDKPTKINFKATGNWRVFSPGAERNPFVTENNLSTGFISPYGFINLDKKSLSELQLNKMPCRDYPLGALVVKTGQVCLASVAEGTFDLEKRQTAYFLMNDDNYSDNEGQVTVELTSAN